jgi:hypothetical protein
MVKNTNKAGGLDGISEVSDSIYLGQALSIGV